MARHVSAVDRCRRIALLSDSLVTLAPLGSAARRMRAAEAHRAHRVLAIARAEASADRARALGVCHAR